MRTLLQSRLFSAILGSAAALAGTSLAAASVGLTLASHGHTRYAVVIASGASAVVRHAAHELAQDLQTISAAKFAVTSAPPTGPAIYVGPGSALRFAHSRRPRPIPPAEGFSIQTFRNNFGNNIALVGGSGRETLYAVYTFLEEHLGVRWYSPHDTVIPRRTVMRVPVLHESQIPAFSFRDAFESLANRHPQWAAHLRLNGAFNGGFCLPGRASLGGFSRMFSAAENFYRLVPPSKYFATHPEYYSLINGKRNDTYLISQLSLVNPGVFRIITAALIAQARDDPGVVLLGLSPNDTRTGDGNSQGAATRASDAHYGAPSGTLLHFVNKVAEAVQRHYPHRKTLGQLAYHSGWNPQFVDRCPHRKIWLETLAYQYNAKPPLPGTIKAGPNVLVYLCLNQNYAYGVTAPQNRREMREILGWEKVAAGHLGVWADETDFAHYLEPFPNWDELGADMGFYHRHGIVGMFCEGNGQGINGMTALRTWVMAHLMWNSGQNVWRLIREFTNGYYGPAGKYIYRYLRLLQRQVRVTFQGATRRGAIQDPTTCLLPTEPPNAPFLAPWVLAKANHLFERAQAAVKPNPSELRRVKQARLGIRYVELMRHVPKANATPTERSAFRARLQRLLRNLRQFHVEFIREGYPVSNWAMDMEKLAR